ncbi:MAG: hypothetical protein D6714_06940 [Bacteroidetes bacterium]|nr:MAG: hypothetical protein D6714_06940 [Bacteroidota bacterium]
MNSTIIANTRRFFFLVLLQGLVLRNIGSDWVSFPYFSILLYPVFIFLLPLRTPKPLVVFLGFLTGFLVDLFYDSPGVHASAATFTAFIRPVVLNYLEPRGGYNVNYSPTKKRMGLNWYMRYAGALMIFHAFFYFFVEAFSPVYMGVILIKTVVGFLVSMIFVLIHQILFDPLE